jgi:DNA-binding CsgD family transcriptional regulator
MSTGNAAALPAHRVGRTAEQEALRAFVERAAVHGGALVLSGDPGSGKSVLVQQAVEHAVRLGAEVLRADGAEFEADLAFAGLDLLLRPLPPEVAELEPAQAEALRVALGLSAGTPPSRGAVADAVLSLLTSMSVRSSVLVVVDDAQWLDRGTARALAAVAKRVAGSRIGVLAAVRTHATSFFDPSGLPELALGPLSDGDAAELVSAAYPGMVERVRQRVVEAAAGNPLALVELPRALVPAQHAGSAPLPATLPLGPRLEELFASRIAMLPPLTRRLLLLAALERSGDVHVLLHAGGEGADRGLRAAHAAGLVGVHEQSGTLTFRHPLVRSTVVERSDSAERQECHRALAGHVPDPERRVSHLAAAAERPDESVAALLERLSHKVLDRGDVTGAVSALLRAAELTPDADRRRERLAQAAFFSVALGHELRAAADLLSEVERGSGSLGGSLNAAMTAALLLFNDDGDLPTCFALLARTMDERGDELDAGDPEVIEALHRLLTFCFMLEGGACWQQLEVLIGRLRPGVPRSLRLRFQLCADPVRASSADLDELEEAARQVVVDSDPVQAERLGMMCFQVHRGELLRKPLWTFVRDAREKEPAAQAAALPPLMVLSWQAFVTGRWDEAEAAAQEGLDIAARIGYRSADWVLHLARCAVAAGRGEHDVVAEVTDEVIAYATPRHCANAVELSRLSRALSALGRRDFEVAHEESTAVLPAGVLPLGPRHHADFVLNLVESAVRTGRLREGRAHAAALQDAGMARLSPRGDMLVAAARALTIDGGDAEALFSHALAVPDTEVWAFDRARVQLLAGEHRRRERAVVEARAALSAARETFVRLRAEPWVERADVELRACGGGRSETAPGSGLTAQEHEVARLAATGLTNRQIAERLKLSPRTVGVHLYRVFPKLGVTSRAALRDALDGSDRRLGQGPARTMSTRRT